jgi:hypothetical protein
MSETRFCIEGCKTPVTRYSKTGRCAKCARVAMGNERRREVKACACGAELHRTNKTGVCAKCTAAATDGSKEQSLEVTGNKATLTRTATEPVRTLADLIRVCEIDTSEWNVERWIANKWEMGAKDADGQVITTPLFQIKATLTRKTEVLSARAEIAALLADAKKVVPARPLIVRLGALRVSDHMLELAIPDLHLGKLGWKPETGDDNYDLKIAERLFHEALECLLNRVRAFKFDQIIWPLGNDFMHSDTMAGTTTRGTVVDNDGRYHKTFTIARRVATAAIERLRTLAPVKVIMVPGNHDTLSNFHLGDSLDCYFHKTSDVTIDNGPMQRKYHEWRKVALMFTHGDKGKAADWPLLFATEQAEMFGRTLYREVHTGHLHQTRTSEHHGVRVRVSPALCSADAWHSHSQFVGAIRGAEAFVWHGLEGLVSVAHYNVPKAPLAQEQKAA